MDVKQLTTDVKQMSRDVKVCQRRCQRVDTKDIKESDSLEMITEY